MRIVFILIIQILLVLPTYALEFNQLYDTDTTNNGTAEQISRYQGKLVAYWTRIGSNPKDKAIAFIFYPKQTHYKYIDLAIKQYGYGQWGLFKVTEPHHKFTREERAENNLQLAKKYFGTLPKSFLDSQEGVLIREGEVTINYITEDGACDSKWLYANLVAFKPTVTTPIVEQKITKLDGCGSSEWFASQDIYIVSAKDGYANVREKPSTQAKVVASLKNGERLGKVLTTENGWYLVEPVDEPYEQSSFINWQGNELYVHASQVKINPFYYNENVKYFIKGDADKQFTDHFYTVNALLYKQPSRQAEQLVQTFVPYTTIVELEKTDVRGWFKIAIVLENNEYKGYIPNSEVVFNAVAEIDNSKRSVILYAEPQEQAEQLIALSKKLQITSIKKTASKDWFYVEIWDHNPVYKGYLKRAAISFY